MSSKKKILANRKNALRSSGPVSLEGEKRSSQNALRHGLRSSKILVIEGEDVDEFDEFRANICSNLNALGPLEDEIADRVAVLLWRLRRIPAIESAMKGHAIHQDSYLNAYGGGDETNAGVAIGYDFSRSGSFYSTLMHYENNLSNLLAKNLRMLQEIQNSRAIEFEQTNPND